MWRIIILNGLNFLDFWTTFIAVEYLHLAESNPIAEAVIGTFGWLFYLFVKTWMVISVYYFIRKIAYKNNAVNVYNTSAAISMVLLFAVVIMNIAAIATG